MAIAICLFSRSNRYCKLQKLNTIYFKSCGLAAKALDTLHALGITMSQKWGYLGIEMLGKKAHDTLLDDIKKYPWFGCHDNLNLGFRVYEQRLSNQSHFDSGTAATLVTITDPLCVPPDTHAIRQQRAIGAKDPITHLEILELDKTAAPRILARAVYRILSILTSAPEFDFETYKHKTHAIFHPPQPVRQLPTGPEHATRQYMLDTVHIEEASYDGNDRVLAEWLCQLQIDSPEERKRTGEERVIVWVGDQLTVSRIRGLKKFRCEDLNSFDRLEHLKEIFGWFHAQIAQQQSLHSQYYGTRAGNGLAHAFDLLKRKGLHSPTVQGTFYHNLREGLHHIATARFRDLWCVIGSADSLKDFRSHTPTQLSDIANQILHKYASTNALDQLASQKNGNDTFSQAIMWNRDILDYLDLDAAIQMGDVGAMVDQLPRLLFRFAGGANSNYALEVLELLQAVYREWPPDFRFVIF
jgi:hypothetical protein